MQMTTKITFFRPLKSVALTTFGTADVPELQVNERERKAYERGKAESMVALQAQFESLRRASSEMQDNFFRRLNDDFEAMVKDIDMRIPDLLIGMLRRLLTQVPVDRAMLDGILKELLSEVSGEGEQFTVFLAPQDLQTLSANNADFAKDYPHVTFNEDHSLKSGDCFVKSRFGVVDGRIETKINKLTRELHGV